MVGEDAAVDAVQRARQEPLLRVGLHLALVEGHSILPPRSIPDLVNARGEFSNNPTRAGLNFMFRPGIREQLEAEIRAQFQAFRKTGLPLDHVNAHNHMHVHPRLLNVILKVGREYGLRAVRLPNEPPLPSWRASRRSFTARLASWLFLLPMISFMKSRLRQERIRFNDSIFGLVDSGAMTTELVIPFVERLPEGVTEMYFHPSTRRCAEIDRTMPKYRHEEEYKTLTSNELIEAFKAAGVERIAFSDL
jgi:hopanoid biosynthesis associated protein HpnK